RGVVDDGAAASAQERRYAELAAEKDAGQIDCQCPLPNAKRRVGGVVVAGQADPGVVEERVEPAELALGFLDHRCAGGFIGDIDGEGNGAPAHGSDFGGDGFSRIASYIRDRNRGAFARKGESRCPADPPARAGHQGALAQETLAHAPAPFTPQSARRLPQDASRGNSVSKIRGAGAPALTSDF